MAHRARSARPLLIASVAAFAAFGAFWGAWGASIPRLRAQAGLDDSELGVALVFVGVGALPAMLVTGKAIDRWGLRATAPAIALLGASGVVVAVAGHGLVSLSVALALVGVTSGASDVVNNSVAGRAERAAGRPVITRAHAVFSTFVVVASLAAGLLASAGAPVVAVFALVGVMAVAVAVVLARTLPGRATDPGAGAGGRRRTQNNGALPTLTLVGFGMLGALAFASENAHQSWSAIFVTDAIGTDVALGSVAPAVFAAAVAITRFAAGGIGTAHARVVLATGSAVAAVGAVIVSTAPNLAVSLVGLITAAAGTAVLFPTVIAVMSARVEESRRGRATSTVTTVAYLGFVLSPVYVGLWSGAVGLRGAMLAVAALGALLLLLTPLVRQPATSWPERERAAAGGRRRG